MLPQEIIDHVSTELSKWLSLDGNDVPQHEIDAEVSRILPMALAAHLSSAMTCMRLVESELSERGVRQLYNWG